MEARALLRQQLTWIHQLLDGTVADCSPETAGHQGEGWTINPIAAIYAHIGLTQDSIVHGLIQGQPPLLKSAGWGERLGITDGDPRQSPDWAAGNYDLPLLRDYVAVVQAATDTFLADAEDALLEKTLTTPMGEQTALQMLSQVGVVHVASHWGEIAALRGVQGQKGLPF